jgi:hypothetical protein
MLQISAMKKKTSTIAMVNICTILLTMFPFLRLRIFYEKTYFEDEDIVKIESKIAQLESETPLLGVRGPFDNCRKSNFLAHSLFLLHFLSASNCTKTYGATQSKVSTDDFTDFYGCVPLEKLSHSFFLIYTFIHRAS